jgi:two-component system, LytTR family, sensor kinase
MDQRLFWLTQLIKLGAAAAIASALVRSKDFKRLLFREDSTLRQRIYLVLFLSVPFALGVLVRQNVKNFLAADLAFEAVILMAVLTGPLAGSIGAVAVSFFSVIHGEFATLPFNVGVALLVGWLRELAAGHEEVWSFSPFFDLYLFRWLRKMARHPQIDWQISFFFIIIALQFARIQVGRLFPGEIFYIDAHSWALLAICALAVATVAIPLKIWNAARIELKLEEHERLLLQARMEALQSQINPHFLFNTLNSVSSLVRVDPDNARLLIVKLANILRRLLRQTDSFVRLHEEVEFIDDYLDIEVMRFGRDKLRVSKDLDPASLEAMVPSMLLQPLVENSIKHGLSPKIEGGGIWLRSRVADDRLQIELEDDGVGMEATGESAPDAGEFSGIGIGMRNVAERLKVLYGDSARMQVSSGNGFGTRITLDLPLLDGAAAAAFLPTPSSDVSPLGSRYAVRSSTAR